MDSRQHILWTFAIGECPVGESLIGEIREPHYFMHINSFRYRAFWIKLLQDYLHVYIHGRCDYWIELRIFKYKTLSVFSIENSLPIQILSMQND